jgi:ubiquitin
MVYRSGDNWEENFWSGQQDRQKNAAGSPVMNLPL